MVTLGMHQSKKSETCKPTERPHAKYGKLQTNIVESMPLVEPEHPQHGGQQVECNTRYGTLDPEYMKKPWHQNEKRNHPGDVDGRQIIWSAEGQIGALR